MSARFNLPPVRRATVELPGPDETDSEHSAWRVGPFTVAVNDDGTVNLVTSTPGHTFGDQVDIVTTHDVANLLGLALLAAVRPRDPVESTSDTVPTDLARILADDVPPGFEHPCPGCDARISVHVFACLPCTRRLPRRLSHLLSGAAGDVVFARARSESLDWFTAHPYSQGGA